MNEFVKNQLLDIISKSKFVKKEITYSTSTQEVQISINKGISDTGIEYDKKKLFQYLYENGLNINKNNINAYAEKFPVIDNFQTETHTQVSQNTNLKLLNDEPLENLSENDINDLKDLLILDYLNQIINNDTIKMEYKVDIITDNYTGGTNTAKLEKSLNDFSKKGYTLKFIFTNELGANSHSVSYGGVSNGTNATIDQIVLIYERPKTTESNKIFHDVSKD